MRTEIDTFKEWKEVKNKKNKSDWLKGYQAALEFVLN